MRLGHREPDGSTRRQHLEAAAVNNGRAHEDLLAKVPAGGETVWEAYLGISTGRPPSFGGGAQIPPTEYVAWQQLHGLRLTSWEVDTLQAMDRAAIAQAAELQPKKAPK